MTQYRTQGKILQGLGGLYDIRLLTADRHAAAYSARAAEPDTPDAAPALTVASPLAGQCVQCRARGVFRYHGEKPLIGDDVLLRYSDASCIPDPSDPTRFSPSPDGTDVVIEAILPRRCALIRPPLANLDHLFVTLAAASPEPMPMLADKLLSIAEFHHITPAVLITKCELDRPRAAELCEIYRLAGYPVFPLSCRCDEGVEDVRNYLKAVLLPGQISAFAGVSGVGKSTLLNALFPALHLETSEISRKIERGRHTTRCVTLYPVTDAPDSPYLADTPGFSMLDFERFDFFDLEDLPETMREFRPYLGSCRYTKCSHTKEQGCAVLEAVRAGKIAPSRHESYCAMYDALKGKNAWDKK